MFLEDILAEGEGFEPPVPAKVQRFSRPPVSTAHPSLRMATPVAFERSAKSRPEIQTPQSLPCVLKPYSVPLQKAIPPLIIYDSQIRGILPLLRFTSKIPHRKRSRRSLS